MTDQLQAPSAQGQEGSPRAAVKYLSSLKPHLMTAIAARSIWLRQLKELRVKEDLNAAHAEAVQVALGQAQQFNEARRHLGVVPVPPNCLVMHRSLDAWLRGMAGSCEAIVKAKSPLTQDTITEARSMMRDAAKEADAFNDERALIVAGIAEATGQTDHRPKFIANTKELRAAAAALIAAMAVVGVMVFALTALGGGGPESAPTSVKAGEKLPDGRTAKSVERRIFTEPQVLTQLKQEVDSRKVAFRDPTVELVDPDTAIVTGRIPSSEVPVASVLWDRVQTLDVRTELKLSAKDGKPRVLANKLSGNNVNVPSWALGALNKRTEEANAEIDKRMKPTEYLVKLWVEKRTIIAEVAITDPPEAAPAPPKP